MSNFKKILYSKNKIRLISELLILFIVIPLMFAYDVFGIPLMLILTLTGLLVFLFLRYDDTFDNAQFKNWKQGKSQLKHILLLFVISTVIMILMIYFIDNERMFFLVRKMPWLLLIISVFYPIFSVLPQSLIYRSLFFHRYAKLFKNDTLKIIFSGIFFSLGHILYKNILVLILAFIAGVIFAYHYNKTKSLTMSVFEHGIYGVCLFASGLGYFFVSHMVE